MGTGGRVVAYIMLIISLIFLGYYLNILLGIELIYLVFIFMIIGSSGLLMIFPPIADKKIK